MSRIKQIEEIVLDVDQKLKAFQKHSMEYVITQLYKKGRNKVLIADEVGLGKTIIAQGVIAKAAELKKKKPFHVVYICSNSVLAGQNVKKLNPNKSTEWPISRLIYLAIKQDVNVDNPIRISSLTPSTSFKLTHSTGKKEERLILYKILSEYADFRNHLDNWKDLMRGSELMTSEGWSDFVNEREHDYKLKSGLSLKLKNALLSVEYSQKKFPRIYSCLDNYQYKSFYHALVALIKALNKNEDLKATEFAYEVIRVLRRELTKICVEFLDADLFILDEFQRFKTLLDGDDFSEAGEIAKIVLHNEKVKVLLLSATPFKPFTTRLEQMSGEEHHSELKKLVEFLGGSNGEKLWLDFEEDQRAFFNLLRHPQNISNDKENAIKTKTNLENTFEKFISRNERQRVASEVDGILKLNIENKVSVIKDDVTNFVSLDSLVRKMSDFNPRMGNRFGSVLEFCKSAPYPLSYLHGYKLREHINEHSQEDGVKDLLKESSGAWLSYNKINNYQPIGFHRNEPTYPNGKLRVLAEECFKHNAESLLWMPPTKPYYKLDGVFKSKEEFSKILIFSGWQMVPRAVSTLLSYEVERRTIGKEDLSLTKSNKEKNEYFNRSTASILVYKKSKVRTPGGMNNFILTYPSAVLYQNSGASFKDVYGNTDIRDYKEVRCREVELLSKCLTDYNISIYQNGEKEDKDWYWVIGPLLDYLESDNTEDLDSLITVSTGETLSHLVELKRIVIGVSNRTIQLGKFPSDFLEVISDMVLNSPAMSTFFALDWNNQLSKSHAFIVGNSFLSLFNKPESVSVIRPMYKNGEYWRKALKYCQQGNLASVMEEYIYMLKSCEGLNNFDIIERLSGIVKGNSSGVNVDLSTKKGKYETKEMRCHFAVGYGHQKINTEEGAGTMESVRSAFNSPFRPFVLTSTSMGQEGLDFHFYCRKIMHWNLPHNAIDLEQREGRINRYKGYVIRKKIAESVSHREFINSVDNPIGNSIGAWGKLFDTTESKYEDDLSGMKPFWYLDEGETKIERFVPIHDLSKDQKKFRTLMKTLGLYRLTFGQPRQEELIDAIDGSNLTSEELAFIQNELLIDLSPGKNSKPKNKSISEQIFFERLTMAIGVSEANQVKFFVNKMVKGYDLIITLGRGKRASLNLKSSNEQFNFCSIQEDRSVMFYGIVDAAGKFGNADVGIQYLEKTRQLLNGEIDKTRAKWRWSVTKGDEYIPVIEYLKVEKMWTEIISNTNNDLLEISI